jgi:hypothetical protein
MRTRPLFLAALPAALALIVALAPLTPARAGEPLPGPDPWSGYMNPPPWAYRNLPFFPYGAPVSGPCTGTGIGWMVRVTGYAAGFMDLKPDQQKALAALQDVAKTQAGKLRDVCRSASDPKATAPERMKQLERAMDAAKDALREVRPRFEDFYQTLAPRQKEIVDDMVAGRGPGYGRWWEDY